MWFRDQFLLSSVPTSSTAQQNGKTFSKQHVATIAANATVAKSLKIFALNQVLSDKNYLTTQRTNGDAFKDSKFLKQLLKISK